MRRSMPFGVFDSRYHFVTTAAHATVAAPTPTSVIPRIPIGLIERPEGREVHEPDGLSQHPAHQLSGLPIPAVDRVAINT